MDLDLVGYLYGLLDPDEHARTEAALRADPAVRERLERLRANLAPLAAAREHEPPPAGLVERTLARIGILVQPSRLQTQAGGPHHKGKHLHTSDSEPVFAPSRWRRADVFVAASVLILAGGLGFSGLGQLRRQHAITVCQNNLRQVHQALVGYSLDRGGRLPQVTEEPPNNIAAAFVPMLQEAGQLQGGLSPCPVDTIATFPNAGGYAYSLGFRGPDGTLHGLRRNDAADSDLQPVMADRQDPASHGNGHNVLFMGGNVRFCTTPNVGVAGDDIFTNQLGQIAPGIHRLDTMLADGHISPTR